MSSFYKKQDSKPGMRQFTVDDPTQLTESNFMPSNVEQGPRVLNAAEREELNRMRQQSSAAPVLGDFIKSRAEYLINMGRATKDVIVEDITFSIRTLKSKENREATLSMVGSNSEAEAAFKLRSQTLQLAIYAIDGQEIEQIVGTSDARAVTEFLEELEESVINAVYVAYLELKKETQDKYLPKTPAEQKGVLEDLKKS